VDFVDAVTDPDAPDFVPKRDRVAVFDNDGTLWTEQPVYAQLVFAIDRAAELGRPTSLEKAKKPSSIHQHVGQRPILAAGNTDGDLAMLQWTAASPYRTLELVVHHTDAEREYAYDRDPILGSGTDQILATAADQKWTVIDMAADWANVHSAS